MRIPLPVFYLAENDDGKTVVVDGRQRLATFHRYLNNDLALRSIKDTSPQLNGKRFKDLPPKLKNRIEDTSLILYLIDPQVPERARLDIFERVNSGVPLTRQQMRNSLYMGLATRWLKAQARSESFLTATTKSLNPKTMRDRELINRFCGFYLLGHDRYRGDMDEFLANTLRYMNQMTEVELAELGQKFQTSMKNNHTVFNRYAFRKRIRRKNRRSVINASLFDVFSTLMTKYSEDMITKKKGEVQKIFYELMANDEFFKAITLSTNSLSNVKIRFEIIKRVFQEL